MVIEVNGRGKSSILSALRVAAGAYLLGIPAVPKQHIQPDEVRLISSETGKSISPHYPSASLSQGIDCETRPRVIS